MLDIGNFSLDQLDFGDISLNGQYPDLHLYDNFTFFSLSDLYFDGENFYHRNLTDLEDFEEFDSRDMLNVIAYAIMTVGKGSRLL